MVVCCKLTSQICAHSKVLRCWVIVKRFSEIIYRDCYLHMLSSCSFAVSNSLYGFSSTKYFLFPEQVRECWNCSEPGFSKFRTWDSKQKKKAHKKLGQRKRTVGILHPTSAAEEMSQPTLVLHSTSPVQRLSCRGLTSQGKASQRSYLR